MASTSAGARAKGGRAERRRFAPRTTIASLVRALLGRVRSVLRGRRAQRPAAGDPFAALVDNLPDAVARFDRDLRCVYVNRAAEALGLARERALGKTGPQMGFLPDGVARAWDDKRRDAIASARETRFDFSHGTAGGLRQYSVRIVPERGGDGSVRSVLDFVSDATDRVEAAGELRRSRAERDELIEREKTLRLEIESVTRDAIAAGRAKDQFLATISHELRAPLNRILGWTQTLRDGGVAPETLPLGLAQIEQGARTQAKLIDDLLSVSDIATGRLRLDVVPMRLGCAIDAAIAALRTAIDAKDIALETRLEPGADVVYGDPQRLQQVTWTLLSNALEFTPRGGRISVTLSRAGSQAEIAVADTGEGIEPGFLPFVFERFRQADASSKRTHGGLGLGLAIARHLVELHGGTVEAASPGKGMGSTFMVRLPLAPIEQPSRLRPGERRPARRDLSGLRILAVDDDAGTREMLQQVFQNAGAEVALAASVREALSKIQCFNPHALVSDIGMPYEDGYDLLRQVRALPPESGGATPAIALTGYTRDKDRAATRDAGYQAVAGKPVDLDELFSAITRLAAR